MAVKKSIAPASTVRNATTPKKPRKAAPAEPPASGTLVAPVAAHDIAMRAYELFLEQGGAHGRDLEHWLTAERELYGQTAATS